jgi:hypothetical protein
MSSDVIATGIWIGLQVKKMQLNNAYLKDFKNGLNLMIFEIPIILKSEFRESLGIPVLING